MPDQADFQGLLSTLKQALKSKGMTYRELAEAVGMSESGIKKFFNGNDCSLQRLLQVSAAVGVSLADLAAAQETWRNKVVSFSAAEQQYFLDDPAAFRFFWLLVYERLSLQDILDGEGTTKRQATSYLRRLDGFGLISWHAGDRITFHTDGFLLWKNEGPFIEKIRSLWSKRLLADACRQLPAGEALFALRYFKLSERSYKELRQALADLFAEFDRRTRREMGLVGVKALKSYRALAVLAEGSYVTGRDGADR